MQEAPGKHFPEYKFCVRLTSDSFTSPTRLGLERLRIYTQMGRRSIVDRFQWTTPVTFSRKLRQVWASLGQGYQLVTVIQDTILLQWSLCLLSPGECQQRVTISQRQE